MDDDNAHDQITSVLTTSVSSLPRKDYSKPGTYALVHHNTGKVYIGSTKDLYKRINQHKTRLRANEHRNKNLQGVYDKDPHFEVKLAITETQEQAVEVEQSLLDGLSTSGKLLNIATDARLAGKGLIISGSARDKLRLSATAQFASTESRQIQSERSKELWKTPEYREKQLNRDFNKPEVTTKISNTVKNLWKDPNYRAKMGHRAKRVSIDGVVYNSVVEASRITGMTLPMIHGRIKSKTDQSKSYFYID